LGAFEAAKRGVLQNAIDELLDPQNEVVRSYVLRLLNAHFFLEASRLDRGTLDLVGSFSEQPTFHIFFDTNFLFSVLQLHSNPSNESAKSLMTLLKQLSSRFRVKLYVLPITVNEAKRTLAAAEESITTTITPHLAAAALQLPQSGLMEKYLSEAANSPKALSPTEYFAPYIKDLVTILKQRGIEVHNGDSEQYRMRTAVTDDINAQIEHEAEIKKRNQRFRVRDYRQWEHDLVLWHFVHDHRPAVLESPLSASHWLVSVDYRLLNFSFYKQRQSNESVPVGVHPATFLQMLQFFIPRSPEFEEAMLGSVRLPFLMREFDGDAERVTLRILRALSRFENVDDLEEGEIVSVLTNDALRGKLSTSESLPGDEELQLVRDALIDEHKAERERFEAEVAAAKRASEIDAEAVRTLPRTCLRKTMRSSAPIASWKNSERHLPNWKLRSAS